MICLSRLLPAEQGEGGGCHPRRSGLYSSVRTGLAERWQNRNARPDRHAGTPWAARTPGALRGRQWWTGRRCQCRIGPVNARTSIHSKAATNANVTRTDRIIPRLPSVVPSAPSYPGSPEANLVYAWAGPVHPSLGRCRIRAEADRLSSRVSPSGPPLTSSVRETIRVIG
jgi:hypothetical protein